MIQAPCIPQQPSYNAVKIDIHNPQVGTPGCAPAVPAVQQYPQPTAPIYDVPQTSVYGAQAVPQQQFPCYYPPVLMPQPGVVPAGQPQVIQQNVNAPGAQIPAQQIPNQQVPAPQVSQPEVVAPEAVQPQVDLNGKIGM